MEEKVIIKAERMNSMKFAAILWGILVGIGMIEGIVILARENVSFEETISKLIRALFIYSVFSAIPALIMHFCYSKVEMTVTDKRVFGTAAFGKRIDLPMDSISAVGISMFNGITVATSSGRIKFGLISNRDDIQKVISEQLIRRQTRNNDTNTQAFDVKKDTADDLKKLKDLLDSGVITQEEFEAKKKQLLGL